MLVQLIKKAQENILILGRTPLVNILLSNSVRIQSHVIKQEKKETTFHMYYNIFNRQYMTGKTSF